MEGIDGDRRIDEWHCPCGGANFGRHKKCRKCGLPKPVGTCVIAADHSSDMILSNPTPSSRKDWQSNSADDEIFGSGIRAQEAKEHP
jgi:hypothetical protein